MACPFDFVNFKQGMHWGSKCLKLDTVGNTKEVNSNFGGSVRTVEEYTK